MILRLVPVPAGSPCAGQRAALEREGEAPIRTRSSGPPAVLESLDDMRASGEEPSGGASTCLLFCGKGVLNRSAPLNLLLILAARPAPR